MCSLGVSLIPRFIYYLQGQTATLAWNVYWVNICSISVSETQISVTNIYATIIPQTVGDRLPTPVTTASCLSN
jgi:hypothetical protein